jgi:hypothetical protein
VQPLVHVRLLLSDELRSLHASGVPFGNVTFHGMRADHLTGAPDGHDAYLVKVNYDIEFEPETPSPTWAEVKLRFTTPEVVVNDALPRWVSEESPPVRYAVTKHLDFIPFEPDLSGRVLHDHVPLPSERPVVHCWEIGSPGVRWRRTGNVRAGSHVGWLTVVTPAGCQELVGEVAGDYALQPADSWGMSPLGEAVGFIIRLPHSSLGDGISMLFGFTVDVVSYSGRSIRQREQVQARLRKLIDDVMPAAGLMLDERDFQGTGDGFIRFFPPNTDLPTALHTLLTALPRALLADNRTNDDQMRLRMAMDIGTVGRGPLGFIGDAVINFCRLVDSEQIREAVTRNPDAPVVVLVSDTVYEKLIKRLDEFTATDFTEVTVVEKNYQAPAYLLVP